MTNAENEPGPGPDRFREIIGPAMLFENDVSIARITDVPPGHSACLQPHALVAEGVSPDDVMVWHEGSGHQILRAVVNVGNYSNIGIIDARVSAVPLTYITRMGLGVDRPSLLLAVIDSGLYGEDCMLPFTAGGRPQQTGVPEGPVVIIRRSASGMISVISETFGIRVGEGANRQTTPRERFSPQAAYEGIRRVFAQRDPEETAAKVATLIGPANWMLDPTLSGRSITEIVNQMRRMQVPWQVVDGTEL